MKQLTTLTISVEQQAQDFQFVSLKDIIGSSGVYPAGTLFKDNGDKTCTPQDGKETYGIDNGFFTAYDPAIPAPQTTFWTINAASWSPMQTMNDGSEEAKQIISLGLFWNDERAVQQAIDSLKDTPKSSETPLEIAPMQ